MKGHETKPMIVASMVFVKDGKVGASGAHCATLQEDGDMVTISDFTKKFGEDGFQAMFSGTVPEGDGLCFIETKMICPDCGTVMTENGGLLNLGACRATDEPAVAIKEAISLMCEEALAGIREAARIAEAIGRAAELVMAFSRAASRPEVGRGAPTTK